MYVANMVMGRKKTLQTGKRVDTPVAGRTGDLSPTTAHDNSNCSRTLLMEGHRPAHANSGRTDRYLRPNPVQCCHHDHDHGI